MNEEILKLLQEVRSAIRDSFYDEDSFNYQDAHFDRLLSRLDKAIASKGWRPIETAPKDGYNILAWDDKAGPIVGAFPLQGEGFAVEGDLDGAFEVSPTYWMPLPEDPQS